MSNETWAYKIKVKGENKMGCNIHLHIEIKIEGKWEHFSAPYMPRDYQLYGKMGGDRGETENPIVKAKGVPDGITLITKIDLERENYHHASWFNIEEIEMLEKWFNERAEREKENFRENWYPGAIHYQWFDQLFGYLFGNGFYKQKRDTYEVQDIRFVFWFDN